MFTLEDLDFDIASINAEQDRINALYPLNAVQEAT